MKARHGFARFASSGLTHVVSSSICSVKNSLAERSRSLFLLLFVKGGIMIYTYKPKSRKGKAIPKWLDHGIHQCEGR
jgi:hypothetical protein